jgi:hypothetical protein
VFNPPLKKFNRNCNLFEKPVVIDCIENENQFFTHKKIDTMQPFMIPIIISLGVFFMIVALRYLENKENMAMIEKGMTPNEHKRKRNQTNPSQTLKNGLLFVGAGLGLLLAIIVTHVLQLEEDKSAGIFFALIAIFGGAGLLGAYFYERKNPPPPVE